MKWVRPTLFICLNLFYSFAGEAGSLKAYQCVQLCSAKKKNMCIEMGVQCLLKNKERVKINIHLDCLKKRDHKEMKEIGVKACDLAESIPSIFYE